MRSWAVAAAAVAVGLGPLVGPRGAAAAPGGAAGPAAPARALVGSGVDLAVAAPDGEVVAVEVEGLPAGATLEWSTSSRGHPAVVWRPGAGHEGTYTVRVRVTDAAVRSRTRTTRVEVRRPAQPGALVALGDSIAAGRGLDEADYLGRDPCWRAGTESYAGRVAARAGLRLELIACNGATTADLLAPGGQVDRAVALNPGLVTLTVGANDLGFTDPERFFVDGALDDDAIEARIGRLRTGVAAVLARLVGATDAVIVLTTYHDPTADHPSGVKGCRDACFAAAAAATVARMNAALASAAGAFPGRVLVADVAPAFAGHGAPNGWGLDALRSRIGGFAGVQPYCSNRHHLGSDDNWVSGLDCVHLNDDGADAYADMVWSTWVAGMAEPRRAT